MVAGLTPTLRKVQLFFVHNIGLLFLCALFASGRQTTRDFVLQRHRTGTRSNSRLSAKEENSNNQTFCSDGWVANSNVSRQGSTCSGSIGTECFYTCDEGYIAIGRHVCQFYAPAASPTGTVAINGTFFGGTCVPLCDEDITATSDDIGESFRTKSTVTCPAGTVPTRYNDTKGRSCLHTTCRTPRDAIGNLTRGAYELFRLARHNRTGIYLDHVDPRYSAIQQSLVASTDGTGLGMVAECVASALGYISIAEAQQAVLLSLRSLNNLTPGFSLERHATGGWMPTFIDADTGRSAQQGVYATDSTGLLGVGYLFASKFFQVNDPHSAATEEIIALSTKLFNSTKWTYIFCNGAQPFNASSSGTSAEEGTCIPWLLEDGLGCSDCQDVADDGYYYFSELMWMNWLAYETDSCGRKENLANLQGGVANKRDHGRKYSKFNGEVEEAMSRNIGDIVRTDTTALSESLNHTPSIEQMWAAWQGRRNHPNYRYGPYQLLTHAPSFVTQLPFYLIHSFNSDPTGAYQHLLYSQWQAEWAFYNSSLFYAGDGGRYGLGAGPSLSWCSGTTYAADQLDDREGEQGCRFYSPYAVAGYAPVAPDIIKDHILQLLSTGESVLPITSTTSHDSDNSNLSGQGTNAYPTTYPLLWRKSLLDRDPLITCAWGPPQVPGSCGITTVDFAAELFGLASLQLPGDFFQNFTDFFSDNGCEESQKRS